MRVIGIVSEFNPYTLGHEYLIRKVREEINDSRSLVMAVMSGSFTQRGLPSIMPKSARTESLLVTSAQKKKNTFYGPDIVLELPFVYSCAPATEFASGAIRTLTATKVVTDIAFGIDVDQGDIIKKLAETDFENNEFYKDSLKANLKDGMSYPASSANAVINTIKNDDELKEKWSEEELEFLPNILRKPNAILALEYIKEINAYNKANKAHPITIHMIRRVGNDYSSNSLTEYPSASAIREVIMECNTNSISTLAVKLNGTMPDYVLASYLSDLSFGKYNVLFYDSYVRDIVDRVTSLTNEELETYAYMGDGLSGYLKNICESRLKEKDLDFRAFEEKLNTKHFTMGRIYRACASLLLGRKESDLDKFRNPLYIRVLGFNKDGRYCLKVMSKCARLPIVHNLSDFKTLSIEAQEIASFDIKSANLQGKYLNIDYNQEWSEAPVMVK